MPTTEDLLTFLELHGTTAHDRCGELFIRCEFDRLIAILMAHTYVSMLPEVHRTGSVWGGVELGERVEFARRTLRDCHTYWFIEEGDDDDPDAYRFFHNLSRGTVEDFWGCMSPEVETFWSSQGLYEDGAFMRYLTPALTVIRQFLDDNAGVAQADEAGA
jgi:hypothetical protein